MTHACRLVRVRSRPGGAAPDEGDATEASGGVATTRAGRGTGSPWAHNFGQFGSPQLDFGVFLSAVAIRAAASITFASCLPPGR